MFYTSETRGEGISVHPMYAFNLSKHVHINQRAQKKDRVFDEMLVSYKSPDGHNSFYVDQCAFPASGLYN